MIVVKFLTCKYITQTLTYNYNVLFIKLYSAILHYVNNFLTFYLLTIFCMCYTYEFQDNIIHSKEL